jgi:superfamily II DNA or RNA helicase
MAKEARPYQSGAFNAALEKLEHVRGVMLLLATGLGKSFIIALLAKH